MGSTRLSLSGIALCVTIAVGCSTHPTPFSWTATSLGVYPASQSMAKKYGIVAWHLYVGRKQMIVTGYRSDGKPVRGVQLSWYTTANGMPAHTKLTMLDGSGATVRRMVGGAMTGHFSADQKIFLDTIRYDMMRATYPASGAGSTQGASFGGLHTQDVGLGGLGGSGGSGGSHVLDVGMQSGNTPNSGPDCLGAEVQQAGGGSAFSCAADMGGLIVMPEGAILEAGTTGASALNSCANWYYDSEHTKSVCDAENVTHCITDTNGTETCDFSDSSSSSSGTATPTQQCDTACLCANYPDTAQGCNNGSGTCSADGDCASGDTCQSGSCQPPSSDPLTENNTSISNDSAPSCGSGDVSADQSNGDVGCSNDTSGGGGASGGSGSTDPGGDTSGGGGSNGPSDYCANDGDSCGSPSDCCSSSCVAGVCGGQCLNDGDSCIDDSDCCGGSCSGGICGSGGGTTCANDGDPCSSDSDCCGGTCDTNSWTCGSGGSTTCANDGDPCSSDSDCCGGTCDTNSSTCGSGGSTACGNPGDSCGSDSDCCSYSCDPNYFYCN